jgi:hypothetical protein
MPEFLNPFNGVIPDRTLSSRELTRAIRLALAAEEEAVHLYEAIADGPRADPAHVASRNSDSPRDGLTIMVTHGQAVAGIK